MKRIVMGLVAGIAISLATILVLEGTASALLFIKDYRGATASKALIRPYTVHDTLLGWVNRPSFTSPDEYGKGIGLATTSLAVRSDGTPDSAASSASKGLVCSGDSYTFGSGVADDHTWCALLGKTLGGVRTYNMGQDDYGLDQSVLHYERDGERIAHETQVLAVTGAQLELMTTSNNGGRFKPTLAIDGGKLVTRNVPVPATTLDALRRANRERVKYHLHAVQAFIQITGMDARERAANRIDKEWTLVEKVLDDLAAAHRSRGTRLVVVYLPVKNDLRPSSVGQRRKKLASYALRRGIPFLDLTTPMRALRADSLDLAFISRVPRGAAPGIMNQYSDLGHGWVARQIAAYVSQPPTR